MRHIPTVAVPFVWISIIIFGLLLMLVRHNYETQLPFNLGIIRPLLRDPLPMPNNNREAVLCPQGNAFHALQHADQLSHIRKARISRFQLNYNRRSTRRSGNSLADIQSARN